MIRLKELKEKKYNPKYEELYKFIYGISIKEILDFSNSKNEKDALDVRLFDDMKEQIIIEKLYSDYVITVNLVDNKKFEDCEYQKIEYYSFKNISNLVKKLKEILKERTNIITIEYENRPHKATYDLLTYAKMEVIADNSLWMELENDDLSLVLTDEILNRMIYINYHKGFHSSRYDLTYHDFDVDIKNTPFNECFIKQTFDTEEEMLEVLKEMIKPCLKKRRLRDIGTRYYNSLIAIDRYGQTKKNKRAKQGEVVC